MSFGLMEILLLIASAIPPAIFIGNICKRVGLPTWLGLLMLIPVLNYVILGYIAYSRWPLDHVDKQN